jgi:pimeloyl-ACP methyl ester carboxylesterase
MKDYLSMAKQSAEYLKSKIGKPPLVSIVLGSGLGNLAKSISDKKEIYYDQIPNFPKTTVFGHDGLLDSFRSGLKQISIPVLILFSENDKVVPVSNSHQLSRLIRMSEIIGFKNCGHELQYEDYKEFCREVEAFIQ